MSEVAALIADLVAAGVSPELVGRVASVIAGRNEAKPKSAAAERQARYRERQASRRDVTSDVTNNVTGDVTSVTNVTPPSPLTSSLNLEKKGSEAIASGAVAPLPVDPVERLWAEGVAHLTAMQAKDRDARSNIGRWLKAHTPEDILGAIRRARDHGSQDPIPLVGRLLVPLAKPNTGKENGIRKAIDYADQKLAEWAEHEWPDYGETASVPAARRA